ncbi:MAG: hypothetical protein IJ506_06610 [Clostridia bacterium]|nr:hypothetical protein [Clostridia bacterium]
MEKRYTERRLWIHATVTPDQSSKEQLRLYKNAGFNVLEMTEDFVKSCSQAYLDCLKYAEEVGLKVYVKEHFDFPRYFSKNFSHIDLNAYPSVIGFFMKDEPNKEEVKVLAKEYLTWFKEKYEESGMEFFINTHCGETEHFQGPAEEYLDLMMNCIYNKLETENKYLSIDEYPLSRGALGNCYLNDSEWVPYTALTAKKCRDNGVRFGAYMQTFGGEWNDVRLPRSIEELRFMAYLYLAFGVQNLGYFTYRTGHEWGFLGVISEEGKPTKLYYLVKELNEELLSFDREYLSYHWNGAIAIDGARNEKPNEPFIKTREFLQYSDKELTGVKAEKDLIVGCFEKNKNERSYVLVSYGEPTVKEDNQVVLTFKTAKKLAIRRNGVKEIAEVKDGKLSLEIKQGEGIFIQTITN